MNSKKGFINIGLILLILGSAMAMISFSTVKNTMNDATHKAFVSVAQTHLNAAQTWYTTEKLQNNITDGCVTFDTLYNNKYIEDNLYDGYVEFRMDGTHVESYIYISNNDYGIYNKSGFDLMDLGERAVEPSRNIAIPYECK